MADQKISQLPPGTATATSLVPVVSGGVTQKVTVQSILDLVPPSASAATVDTTTGEFGVILEDLGDSGLVTDMPLQQYASLTSQTLNKFVKVGATVDFNALGVNDVILIGDSVMPGTYFPDPGNNTRLVVAPSAGGSASFGSITYHFGGLQTADIFYGFDYEPTTRAVTGGYQLPRPTGDGFLRSDADINTGWYFAEPVVVSDTQPPSPVGGGAIWIDPTGDSTGTGTFTGEFTAASPITVAEDPLVEQLDGTPIGLSADGLTFHQPLITGAIPVVIGGKKYLIPVIDV
jgi:hypothetical protein